MKSVERLLVSRRVVLNGKSLQSIVGGVIDEASFVREVVFASDEPLV